jgi:hypothetical protein
MSSDEFTISFPDLSTAEGNRASGSLLNQLREVDPTLVAHQARSNKDSQDFGATLILVLGTASVTAIAKGMAAWISRQPAGRGSITISHDGAVVAEHIDSGDVARIAEAFAKRKS